jgi:hypothetical protein
VRSRLLALVAGGHTATSLKWAVPNNEAKRPIEESADNNTEGYDEVESGLLKLCLRQLQVDFVPLDR